MSQPFQLTEKSFRRYEDHIKAFVDSYPSPHSINPAPLSPNTFAARLRDAMQSLELYGWSTTLNIAKFKDVRKHVVVKINKHGNVVVCDRHESLDAVGQAVAEPPKTKYNTMHNVTDVEMTALITLLSSHRIEPVKITGQNSATVNLACAGHDVEFIEEKDGIIIL